MRVPLEQLKATTLTILAHSGYPPEEAQIIHDVLMYAQLRGNNQGIVKLIGAGMPRDPNAKPIAIIRDHKLAALIDGGRNSGMVVVQKALEMALEKAAGHGVGIVGTNNTTSSTGAIGYYASMAARAGYIAFVFAGSHEYVAMHGAYEPIFGTNPLAIGIPAEGEPLVFDMATSAIARFGIIEAQTAGKPLPEGVAWDAHGQPTTDPGAALAGAIRAFGGYKGAALAMMVEILTHQWVDTKQDASGKKIDAGNLIMLIDPALLTDAEAFRSRVEALRQQVKATKRLPGVDEILTPGERGNRLYQQILAEGIVEIEDRLWTALEQAAGGA
ncbi:Ldh family oxidoreductase [Kamptonema cortianum]|nr:Ldh family oxidoreductase [Kamptonema cortianum]